MDEETEEEFLFAYEEKVRLKTGFPELGVSAGAIGVICGFYKGGGYEVVVCDSQGQHFSTIMLEDELEKSVLK